MMRKIALFFLILPLTAIAGVKVTDDRFKRETRVNMDPAEVDLSAPSLHAAWTIGSAKSNQVFILSTSKGWKYLNCHNVDWLIDGKPVQMREAIHHGDVVDGGYVIESLTVLGIDTKLLDRLATASTVEYRICRDEYRANPEDMRNFKDFAAKVHELLRP